MTRIAGTLHEYQCTFLIISRSIFCRMRNVSDTSCTEYQNIYLLFFFFFFRKSSAVWDNVENSRAGHAIDDNMVPAGQLKLQIYSGICNMEYVITTYSFPLLLWLHERALFPGYTYQWRTDGEGLDGSNLPPPQIPTFWQSRTGLQIERKMFSVLFKHPN